MTNHGRLTPSQTVTPVLAPIGQVVFEGKTPNLHEVHFRVRPSETTTASQMVAVEGKNSSGNSVLLLARVDNVFDHNPHEDPMQSTVSEVIPFETKYAPEGDSTVIFRKAQAELLEEAVLAPDGTIQTIHEVQTLPRAGAAVYMAGPDFTAEALGFNPDPSDSLETGRIHGSDILANINRSVVQRHILICGGIGSGKSYTRGVLAEELARHGVPQVNIDVNGELIDAVDELGGLNMRPGVGGFTLPLSALTAGDVVEAIPAINRGTNIETLVQFAHEQLLRERSLARGDQFGVADLCTKIEETAPQLDMKANTWKPAQLRAQSLERLSYIGKSFDWEKQLTPGRIINIDCRELLITDLRLIVASIARDIQRLASRERLPFVVLSVDEFHLVAPHNEDLVASQVLRELARLGRHLRIGLILTTQSPSDVDRSILKRLLTRFLHAIEPDQLDALRGVFSDASPELVRKLPKMPVGTCILTGAAETIKHATMIDIRTRATTHGGGNPPIWDDLANRGWTTKKSFEEILRRGEHGSRDE